MKFTTIVSGVLLGFLVKNSSCKSTNNFDIDNINSICCKKVKELKELFKSIDEKVKKHNIEDEVGEDLKIFLNAVEATELRCKNVGERAKDEKETTKRLLAEPNKPSEQELVETRGRSNKENNDRALEWIESYHDVSVVFSELDFKIILAIGKKTSFKVVEEYVANYEIKSSGFFTSFTSMAILIPFILVLSQII